MDLLNPYKYENYYKKSNQMIDLAFFLLFILINVDLCVIINIIQHTKGFLCMARQLKNGHYININVDMDVYRILEEHCMISGQTKTIAIERAIRACYGPDKSVNPNRGLMMPIQTSITDHEGD